MKKYLLILILFGIFLYNLRFLSNIRCNTGYAIDESSTAEAMVVMDRFTGRILYEKNKDKILPMASTTKILTAIVAIENCFDLDKKHLITKDMTGVEGSSIYLKAGEYLSIRELLYGLMLRSGNDSAVAIAKIIAGSLESFVELMNKLSLRLNLTNTNIVTVNGLHDNNHYTTACDLARISCYALKNELFQEIVKTQEKVISNDLDEKYKCRLLKNKNKLLKKMEGGDGVKTGYTTKAGKCFVGSATRGDFQVVCALLNCNNIFEESERLINKAFKEYSYKLVQSREEFIKIKNNLKLQNKHIFIKNNTFLPLKENELDLLKFDVQLFDKKCEDGCVGIEYFLIENNLIFYEKIYSIEEEKSRKMNIFKENIRKIIRTF